MSFAELKPELQSLPRAEKLQVIQFLVADLTRQEGVELLRAGEAYPIWAPYDAHEAAGVLLQLLEQDQARS